MANVDSAFGLRPVRYIGGAPYNGAANAYAALDTYDTDLFIGDPVVVTGNTSGKLAVVQRAAAGATNQITGVVVGFEPTPGIVSTGYGAASTARTVLVADDPALLFEIQEDSAGNAVEAAEMNLNANLVAGTGSTYFKKSGFELDSDGAAADATFQLTIKGVADREDNDFPLANAKLLVTINIHTNRLGAVAGL
jgi:hypothetical protein